MPPRDPNHNQPDPYLFLLERIDSRQEEMGADIKSVQAELGRGAVRFENHEGRLRALETQPKTDRTETQPKTDRTERKAKPDGERVSIGGLVRVLGAVFAGLGLLIGAYFAGQGKTKAEDPPAPVTRGSGQ